MVDGLGGTVKRSVWRHVRSGQSHVTTPTSFHDVARQCYPIINISFISIATISENRIMFEENWERTKPVPNTHKLHYVQASGQYHVLVAETSDAHRKSVQLKAASEVSEDEEENFDEVSIAQTDTDSEPSLTRVAVADWVIVTYDGLEYPGEVLSVDYDLKELRVSVMHRSGRSASGRGQWTAFSTSGQML